MKNGDVLIKHDYIEGDEKTVWINYTYRRTTRQFEGFEDVLLGKIIKIEEPTSYTTVYEAKKEILDEKEKDFLANIVKPKRIREKVIHIVKRQSKNRQFIRITVRNDAPMDLPWFEANTMYKDMEVDKKYSLEDLGL